MRHCIWVKDNPETVDLLQHKAASGASGTHRNVNPEAPAIELRGREEHMVDGLVGRVRMANAYYAPLIGSPGVEFRIHHTTLYNSLYRYDEQMLVNHHVYGVHGFLAPTLHLSTRLRAAGLTCTEHGTGLVPLATMRESKGRTCPLAHVTVLAARSSWSARSMQ